MIGVLVNETERDVVREFFELFKTPWEFYDSSRNYDVVLSTCKATPKLDSCLVILYSSDVTQFDTQRGYSLSSCQTGVVSCEGKFNLVIYGSLSSVTGRGRTLLAKPEGERVAIEIPEQKQSFIRVGYDLFQEVKFLLTQGQPAGYSLEPTLENHINLLRTWIVSSGIPLIEIPPVPYGYSLIACLTHDVDFAGIRYHKFDRTFWGFLYRALVSSPIEVIRGNLPVDRMLKNWKAVLSLPLVYFGLAKDFWDEFETYAQLDAEGRSTFFIIPYKKYPGGKFKERFSKQRATQYDISDIASKVKSLRTQGFEIGLHGLDAWHDVENAKQELKRITEVTGQDRIGIRMHWLYFDEDSPSALEQAGFDYDSTCGFNESIGFKNGTSQPFRPQGATRLLELPMVIQDTSLFYPQRMKLNEAQACEICERVLNNVIRVGGVLVLSWHTRSLSPERLWGEFYKKLLDELRDQKTWFGTALQVVDWFRQRRSIIFEEASLDGGKFKLKVKEDYSIPDPQIFFRIHIPSSKKTTGEFSTQRYCDFVWNGDSCIEIPLEEET